MITYDLKGKTALVTGGASGIGFATARMLAKFGATAGSSLAYSATKAGVVALRRTLRAPGPGGAGQCDRAWRCGQLLDGGVDQRRASAVDRAGSAEAPLPARGFGRGRAVPRLWRGDGDRADDHGRWWPDALADRNPAATDGRHEAGHEVGRPQNVRTMSEPKVKELLVPSY